MDSSCLVLAVQDAGMKPIIVSFTLNDRKSIDFIAARKLAKYFKLSFIPVYIPITPEFVIKTTIKNMKEFGLKKKTDIECMFAFLYMIDYLKNIGASNLLTGMCNSHFLLSNHKTIKKLHLEISSFQKMKDKYYSWLIVDGKRVGEGTEQKQVKTIELVCANYDIKFCAPFWTESVYKFFYNMTYQQLNKPRQKEILRKAFPELDELKIQKEQNFNVGDSGISELVGETMRKKFTPNKKTPISAYNYLWKHNFINSKQVNLI